MISCHFITLQSVMVCRSAISLNMYAHKDAHTTLVVPITGISFPSPQHREDRLKPTWELDASWPRASTMFTSCSGFDPSGIRQESICHLHPHARWLGFISWNPPGWIWCTVTGFKCHLFSLGLLRQSTHLIFYQLFITALVSSFLTLTFLMNHDIMMNTTFVVV